jgi:hypothetical protein
MDVTAFACDVAIVLLLIAVALYAVRYMLAVDAYVASVM